MRRLSRLPCLYPLSLLLLFVVGCGDVEQETDAGSDPDAGPVVSDAMNDAKPVEPDADVPPECTGDGTSCSAEGDQGICQSEQCTLCGGEGGDAACQSAYGSDHICIGGSCEVGECHDATDCGGHACVDYQCSAGCDADDDCGQGQVCNVGNGNCVANTQCGGQSAGEACNVNPDDMCCTGGGGGLVCKAVECCSDAQCGASENCVSGGCVPDGSGGGTLCAAPSGQTVHVAPSHVGASTGSAACPYKKLASAFNYIRNNDLNTPENQAYVVVHSKVSADSEGADAFPLTVPAYTTVRGVLEEARPVIEVPTDTSAFEVPYGGAVFRHLNLRQVALGTTGAGLRVTGGSEDHPVKVDDIYIHLFNNGINVGDGGRLQIGPDTQLNENDNGLYVNGGRAYVDVAPDELEVQFNDNTIGIYVGGSNASFLHIDGALDAEDNRLVRCSGNAEYGIRFQSTEPGSELWATACNNNGKSGLLVYQGSTLKVRNSAFRDNGDNGVRAIPNGGVHDLSEINLGLLPDSGGENVFSGNEGAGICATETGGNTSTWITAEGNTFGSVDCTIVPGTISWSPSCADAVDVGFAYNGFWDSIDTSNCVSVAQ
jgi:hypothetical protein